MDTSKSNSESASIQAAIKAKLSVAKNLYSPVDHTPEEVARIEKELKRAWARYGKVAEYNSHSESSGLTDQEIKALEERMCQRLPTELKAFLKIYMEYGKFFHEHFEFYSAGQIGDQWSFYTSLSFDSSNASRITSATTVKEHDPNQDTYWTDSYLVPIATEHTETIFIDIRNGRVVESIDHDFGPMANSLTELLDELANQLEKGKTVTRLYEVEGANDFLQSGMWYVFDEPPDF